MTSLVRYDAMLHAITKCHRVDEIVQIKDKARQLAAAAKVAKDTSAVCMATEIRVRAERRLGQLLEEQPKNVGAKGIGKSAVPSGNHTPPTLEQLGVSKKLSTRSRKLAKVTPEQFEAAVAVAREVAAEVTAATVLNHKNGHRSKMADADTPVVIPAARMKSDEAQISGLFDALELLASFPISAEDLRGKVRHYQRHRISNHLEASIAFLTALRAHWEKA